MNNKRLLLILPLLLLVSCADTDELYDGDAYATQNLLQNRYSRWDEGLIEPEESRVLPHAPNGFFYGSGDSSSPSRCYGLAEGKAWHPDFFRENGKELFWTEQGDTAYGNDTAGGNVGQWVDNSSLVGTVYGQTKKMSRYSKAFSSGYLSKLYNGQVKCDGWSSYSMVLLDKEGYGTIFPSEMQDGSYFAFSARGASDTPDSGKGRVLSMDITITFYKYAADGRALNGTAFLLPDVHLQANFSSDYTSLVGFSFQDANYDPAGTVGMSMTYALKDDPLGASDDFSDGASYHVGLSLLEVFFPDSTWN